MPQLAFSWPLTPSSPDLIVTDCNRALVHFIDNWPTDNQKLAIITGAKRSGKTALANRWAQRTGAIFLSPEQLGAGPSETLFKSNPYGCLENIDTLTDEIALFHLLRFVENSPACLLLTSQCTAPNLPFQLPDLRSRLAAALKLDIPLPDDELLRSYITRYCSDHQWHVAPQVIDYLLARTERSLEAVEDRMKKVESLLFATGKELTIPLIKPLMEP